MSYHFDTDQVKQDPRLNLCDMYLFDAGPGRTAMALTVNADAGLSSPDVFHPEGIYAFRFDTDEDGREDLAIKVRFGEPRHADGGEHWHIQDYRVLITRDGRKELDGQVVIEGETGEVVEADGIRAFAGLVPELWAADALAFQIALVGVITEDRFHPEAFNNHQNTFERRNAMAVVLELPNELLGAGRIRMWGTISLFGHAPEIQVNRYGLPLFTHMFMANPTTPGLTERYHASDPTMDRVEFRSAVRTLAARMLCAAGTVRDPDATAERVADRFCPDLMPYTIGTAASFGEEAFNGRTLTGDAYDVVWRLVTGQPIADNVAPNASRTLVESPISESRSAPRSRRGLHRSSVRSATTRTPRRRIELPGMIVTIARRSAVPVPGLALVNVVVWAVAFAILPRSLARTTRALVRGPGLRHALDADHIVAIHNAGRRMTGRGRNGVTA